jgi:hypothetical protein
LLAAEMAITSAIKNPARGRAADLMASADLQRRCGPAVTCGQSLFPRAADCVFDD